MVEFYDDVPALVSIHKSIDTMFQYKFVENEDFIVKNYNLKLRLLTVGSSKYGVDIRVFEDYFNPEKLEHSLIYYKSCSKLIVCDFFRILV